MKVLDLFCGMGGLSSGFRAAGFSVTGVDKSKVAGETFELNGFGKFLHRDLSEEVVHGNYDVLAGGPPCRPWSSVNTVKRGKDHGDYQLVGVYFKHLLGLKPRPKAFVFENVPPVKNSGTFDWWANKVEKAGYAVLKMVVRYSEFGASTRRRRFITLGVLGADRRTLEESLEKRKKNPTTVKSRIWELRDKSIGEAPYHEWPNFTTIAKYTHLYRSGKYGWYQLKWDEPAPSFGNVMKTYILHPQSFNGGDTRVISVREAFLVMGFDSDFKFPENAGIGVKYQMIADSVSPVFSKALAETIKEILAV